MAVGTTYVIRIFNQYFPQRVIFLFLFELLAMIGILVLSVVIRLQGDPQDLEAKFLSPGFWGQLAFVLVCYQVCLYYNDQYRADWRRSPSETFFITIESLGAANVLLAAVYFFLPDVVIGRGVLVVATLLAVLAIPLCRWMANGVSSRLSPPDTLLLLGNGTLAQTTLKALADRADLSFRVVGSIPPETIQEMNLPQTLPYVTADSTRHLEEVVREERVIRIVVAYDEQRNNLPVRELLRLRVQGMVIEEASSAITSFSGRVPLDSVRPSWFIFTRGFRRSQVTLAGKRTFDLIASIVGLLLTLPVMAVVALIVRYDSPGPVLYRQRRVGYRGQLFTILKFRSMRTDAEVGGAQWAQKEDPRVTRFGRIMRKYRLDELPQFWNVITGDMSFVGPRPERPEFVEALTRQLSYYSVRHSVRPGLTGWAQVRYPYGATVEDAARKLEYELFYLKNMSLAFDAAILLETVRTVIFGKGQ